MNKKKQKIAEMVGMLPSFIGTVLEGAEIDIPIKLSQSEENTLLHIFKCAGKPMSEYSRKVGLSKGSFTSVADSLEDKGLIKRETSKEDRRIVVLYLTDEGNKLGKKVDDDFTKHIETKIAHLNEEDTDKLKAALEVIVNSIDSIRKG